MATVNDEAKRTLDVDGIEGVDNTVLRFLPSVFVNAVYAEATLPGLTHLAEPRCKKKNRNYDRPFHYALSYIRVVENHLIS